MGTKNKDRRKNRWTDMTEPEIAAAAEMSRREAEYEAALAQKEEEDIARTAKKKMETTSSRPRRDKTKSNFQTTEQVLDNLLKQKGTKRRTRPKAIQDGIVEQTKFDKKAAAASRAVAKTVATPKIIALEDKKPEADVPKKRNKDKPQPPPVEEFATFSKDKKITVIIEEIPNAKLPATLKGMTEKALAKYFDVRTKNKRSRNREAVTA